MGRFAIKALFVMTLVCLVFDWSHATTLDRTKDETYPMTYNIKKTESHKFRSIREAETSQKAGFFSEVLSNLKSIFRSKKTNPDDKYKHDAIKAFDDYAIKHPKN